MKERNIPLILKTSLIYFAIGALSILLINKIPTLLFPQIEGLPIQNWLVSTAGALTLYFLITNWQAKIRGGSQRPDEIAKAAGLSAELFLKSPHWEKNIEQVLAWFGQASDASRVFMYKKEPVNDRGGVSISIIYEWCKKDVTTQVQNDHLNHANLVGVDYTRWVESFNQGIPIYGKVKDLPASERVPLQSGGVFSIVCIPIQIGMDWWGFIEFDQCEMKREWSEAEIEAMQTAAGILGPAIERKQSEDALINSEVDYRGLFNSVRDAIYIQDRRGVFLDVNDGAAQMYGYPREFFIGKTPEFLSAPDKNSMAKLSKAISDAFEGKPQEFEFWGIRSNGEIFPKDVRLFKGAYFGQDVIIAVAQDITSRKEYEEALQNQLRELSVLHTAALIESTSLNANALIQQITDVIGNTLYSDNCGVLLLNETQDILTPHYSYRGSDIEKIGESLPVTKGISGKVVTTRRSIRVDDVSIEPSYYEVTGDTRSELCVPIISGPKIFGVLNVESRKVNAFTERDERLLNTIAGGMANALERIQLFELEKKRRQQAEILREVTSELTSSFEREKLFEDIFTSLERLIYFDSASIEIIKKGYSEIIAGRNIAGNLIGIKYQTDPQKWRDREKLRQPVIIHDVQTDDRFVKFEATNYIRGWMGIPLIAQNKLIGFLNLDSRIPGFFNEEHAAIAQTFANQAAVAIENTRLFELEQRRRREAEQLSLATSSLTATLDINDLYEIILDWLQKLAPFDSASIMLNQGDNLRLAAKRNLPEEYHIGREFPITNKWRHVAENRKPLIIEDAQKEVVFEQWTGTEYIRGWMSAAMFSQDTLIGFLNLDSMTPGRYSEEHATQVQTFANQAATVIEKARIFELEKKRRETAETVRQAATALTNLLDLPSLHSAILEWLYKIAPYDSASILEIEEGDRVRITATRGLPNPEKAAGQTFSSDNALCKIIDETGQTLIIDDCREDPRFEKWGDSEHVRGWMGVPLISRGQVIGYITVDSRAPNAFTQNDATAAQTFAQQAAASLENVRLYTETSQRLEELEMVSRVSYALRAARDMKEMLPILLEEIKSSTGTDSAAIWLYDPRDNLLIPQVLSGKLKDMPKNTFNPNEGVVGKVYSSGTSHISLELTSDMAVIPENAFYFEQGWSGIAIPIRTTSEIIGVIGVAMKTPRKIETHYARLITTIAEIAGNAIHRSNLYERSDEQVRRLTALREMDTAITSSLDLRITLHIITEHLISKMGVSAASILVFNPDSQMLDYYAASGFQNRELHNASLSIGDGFAGQILLNRRPVHIADLEKEFDYPHTNLLAGEKFRSYYAIPLFSKGAARGILETYFKQPFAPNDDWMDFLQTLAGQATIAIDNTQLFENLQRTNQELSLAYDTTLEGWGKALELRDKETQGHTQRVTNLTMELARQMGIPEAELTHIRRGALLHDIGKMGVPDSILRKPTSLTDEEMFEMRKHPQYAYDLLSSILYLRPALDIPYCHHEWWNGSGYPRGLKGGEIPLPARIFAVVDVWDALLSDRPYRKAWEEPDVMKYIADLSGKQFDPQILSAFHQLLESKPKVAHSNPSRKKKKSVGKKTPPKKGTTKGEKKKAR